MCYSSCWLSQLCLKQPTADGGGETLSLKKGWKNSKLWLFSWGKNHHWAICIGPVYSGEQLLCAHSPSEEVKRLLFWEKNTVFSFSPSPQSHPGAELMVYGCSASATLRALGRELSSTPSAASLVNPLKTHQRAAQSHHPPLPFKHTGDGKMGSIAFVLLRPPSAMGRSGGFPVHACLWAPVVCGTTHQKWNTRWAI